MSLQQTPRAEGSRLETSSSNYIRQQRGAHTHNQGLCRIACCSIRWVLIIIKRKQMTLF